MNKNPQIKYITRRYSWSLRNKITKNKKNDENDREPSLRRLGESWHWFGDWKDTMWFCPLGVPNNLEPISKLIYQGRYAWSSSLGGAPQKFDTFILLPSLLSCSSSTQWTRRMSKHTAGYIFPIHLIYTGGGEARSLWITEPQITALAWLKPQRYYQILTKRGRSVSMADFGVGGKLLSIVEATDTINTEWGKTNAETSPVQEAGQWPQFVTNLKDELRYCLLSAYLSHRTQKSFYCRISHPQTRMKT